ncbi:MAG: LLM class flavin-dependent oxidoreductase [Acidobacteria bacterium]|nr:LLM class flavin-dependent oxidoreductase [Acidobacteriota bacterium]
MSTNHNCVEIFSTCPQSSDADRETYLRRVVDVARWSEDAGCKGILVYTDNSLVDPWPLAQVIIQNTQALCPLVAIQPIYMHPYTVAKKVASLGFLYGRRIYLNMVAGGFKNDLISLNDTTPHDQRYDRLVEYTKIIKLLLSTASLVSFEGQFYKVSNVKMTPPLPPELFPGIFISGSSEAGHAAAQAVGATAIMYPKPAREYLAGERVPELDSGVRVGIIARDEEDEAWRVAHGRFPEDRKGKITHELAMKTSDSSWHKQLSEMAKDGQSESNPYWLVPFENYKTFCPYLVGSYECVSNELARYVSVGYHTFILDVPPDRDELHHVGIAFDRACNRRSVAI